MSGSVLESTDVKGAFIRKDSLFREVVSDSHPVFKPESGRYLLIISYACPWANRCAALCELKGLTKHIGLSIVHPLWKRTRPDSDADTHSGWTFANPGEVFEHPSGATKLGVDTVAPVPPELFEKPIKYVRDIYEADPNNTEKKYTVPILFDTKTKQIVNNESSEIIVMLNSNFNSIAENPSLDLNPADLIDAQKEVDEWIYPCINNGVYRCGFAKTQEAYEVAFADLFGALDKLEGILAEKRYVTGDRLTLSDIRLFMTLIRFDEVYVVYFKTNGKRIIDYPNIHEYCKELYQMQPIQNTIMMDHIKGHYYMSHPHLNSYGIVPHGPGVLEELTQPHNRESIGTGEPSSKKAKSS
jgi:putative glutathione S-transferase